LARSPLDFARGDPEPVEGSEQGRTLLVTTDPASSLSAVLNRRVGSHPEPVKGARNLYAASLDAPAAFDRWLAPRRDLLAAIAVRGTYLDDEDVARLLKLSLPGIDEVIGLLEITRMAEGFDRIVVDTAPTGHTLRLLAAPALLGRVAGVLDTLQAHHRAVVAALRGSYRGDAADTLIGELERDGGTLAAMLRDPAASEVTWVTLPEPMALEETADALASLDAAGIPVRRLIVNRITPPPSLPVSPKRRSREGGRSDESGCDWCDARRRFEARAMAPAFAASQLRRGKPSLRRDPELEVLALSELAKEPRGIAALREASSSLKPWKSPAATPALETRVRALSVPPKGGSYKSPKGNPVASALRRKGIRPADLLEGKVRWLLFGGKGGVGKSTCAAATALDLAARDRTRRVLLLSMDPAHSLGDVFGAALGDRARAVPGGPANLHVREIDAAAEMARFRETYVTAVDDAFAKITRTAGADQAAFRELIDLAPPGIDEVIAVADVAEALTAGKGHYDVIVTDTAPTGHALRLLQTPAVLREWTQALMAILLKYREIVGAGTLASLLVQLSKRLRGLQEILADPAQTRFVVVTRAAALPAEESESLIVSLRSLGIAVQAVIVNAVGAGSCPRCRARSQAEAREIGRLRRTANGGGYAIIEAPAEVPPPHGAGALAAWGTAWRQIT
jgi:arsenite/tail-anchored protein-transporting ATPase